VLTAVEHPVLRFAAKSVEGTVTLTELDTDALQFEGDCFLKFLEAGGKIPSKEDIHRRLVDEARKPSQKDKCLFTLTAVQHVDGLVFFLVVNHGVTDGTSVFPIVDSLCRNIASIVDFDDQDLTTPIHDELVPVPRDLVAEVLADSRMSEPEDSGLSEDYSTLLKLPKLTADNSDATSGGCMRCIFLEVDRDTTAAILANCRLHKVSFQALLGAVASLALYKLLSISGELDEAAWNASVVHTCPMNLRRYLQAAEKISSCLSSGLTFRQPSPGSAEGLLGREFWAELVERDVQTPLRACIDSNFALHCMKRVHEGRPVPPSTLITSSVGNISSVQEHYGSSVSLRDVTMQAGFYAPSQEGYDHPTVPAAMISAGMPGHAMLHAYTVFGRLKLSGEYYAYTAAFIGQYFEEVHRLLCWAGTAEAEQPHIRVGDMFTL